MKLRIALVQMEIKDGDKKYNLDNALDYLDILKNSKNKPEIVCFPELFSTGYDLKNVKTLAELINGHTLTTIILNSENNFAVVGSFLESHEENFYNTAFFIDKKGNLIGKYRKTHLFMPMGEKKYLNMGNKIETFTIKENDGLKFGLALCYDLRFPEVFRKMALEGAKIIFLPSEFPNPKQDIWEILVQARAIENQIFIIGINRVGKGIINNFFGHSIVTNGIQKEILGDEKECRIVKIDLESLNSIRKPFDLLSERRTDLY